MSDATNRDLRHQPSAANQPESRQADGAISDSDRHPLTLVSAHHLTSALLPDQPTRLVDREREFDLLTILLTHGEGRLLTIVGPGGVGKTRLAYDVVRSVTPVFEAVVAVDLTGVSTAEGLLAAITKHVARDLTLGQAPPDAIRRAISERRLLLFLDNCEQAVEAGPTLAELLSESGQLRILATSRRGFHIRWERVYRLQPLAVPDESSEASLETLATIPAVALLIERIRDVQPEFILDQVTAPMIASIARQTDGLPLAIELAASQLRSLPLRNVSRRLAQPLAVLTDGARDLPPRQQSLRKSIHASYVLLSADEQAIARQLAILGVRASIADIEAVVVANLDTELSDALTSLADQSLIQFSEDADGVATVQMLTSVHAYLLEQLERSPERDRIYRRLLQHWIRVVMQASKGHSRAHRAMMERVTRNHASLCSILEWSIAADQAELGVQLASRIWPAWLSNGEFDEGRQWLDRLLEALPASAPDTIRAEAQAATGLLALRQGLLGEARQLLEQALTVFLDDNHLHQSLSVAAALACALLESPDPVQVNGRLASLVEDLRASSSHGTDGWLKVITALIAAEAAPMPPSAADLEAGLRFFQQRGDETGTMQAAYILGMHDLGLAAWAPARQHFDLALTLARRSGDQSMQPLILAGLADAAVGDARLTEAAQQYRELLGGWRTRRDYRLLVHCLEGIGALAERATPATEAGLPWFAGGTALRKQTGYGRTRMRQAWLARFTTPTELDVVEDDLKLDSDAIDEIIGRALVALEHLSTPPRPSRPMEPPMEFDDNALNSLSLRERDVAHCISRGLTNRQIAIELGIAERTVDSHVGNVLRKLQLSSRSQIAAWAVRHRLIPRA